MDCSRGIVISPQIENIMLVLFADDIVLFDNTVRYFGT